jgi:hypothetical protein
MRSEGHGSPRSAAASGEVVGASIWELYRDVPEVLDSVRRAPAGEEVHALVEVLGRFFDAWFTPLVGADGVETAAIAHVDRAASFAGSSATSAAASRSTTSVPASAPSPT